MNRIIGETLGTYTLRNLPWIATPVPTNKWNGESKSHVERILDVLSSSKEDIKRLVKGGVDVDEINLEYNNILDIKILREEYNVFIKIIFEPIEATIEFKANANSLIFIYDNVPLFRPSYFPLPQYLNPKDKLIVNHAVNLFDLRPQDLRKFERNHNI